MVRQFQVEVGDVLHCIENTYIPSRAGCRVTITKAGVNVLRAEMDGKGYIIDLPTRKRDEWEKSNG